MRNYGRNVRAFSHQRDPRLICRQSVECGPVERRKAFKLVKRAFFLKDLHIAFEREGRVEYARATAISFLLFDRVGRAIGAKEKFGRA